MSFQRFEYSSPTHYSKHNRRYFWRLIDSEFSEYVVSDYNTMKITRVWVRSFIEQLSWPLLKAAEVYKRRGLDNIEFVFGVLKWVGETTGYDVKSIIREYDRYDTSKPWKSGQYPYIDDTHKITLFQDYKAEFDKYLILL